MTESKIESKRALYLNGPIGKAIWTLALPITLGNILQTGYFMTDAFWVGRLGASAVAAVAVSAPVTFLVIALGSGLAVAGAVLSAQYMGAGQTKMVNHVAAQTMIMVAITSAVLGFIGYCLSPFMLHALHVAPDVFEGALGFMRVSFVGIIFVFLYAMFQALMRGIGQTRIPLIIVGGTVVLNFILDPLFIFGWGPLAPQGVMGAALATLVTQAIAAALGIIIFLRGRHGIQLHWRDFKPDIEYVRRAFRLGMPGSVELSMRALGPMALSFMAAGFGTLTTAAYGVGSNLLQIVIIPAMGISMAVSTLVGQNMGARNIDRAERITVLGSIAAFFLLTGAGALAYLFASDFAAVFVPHDEEVIRQASVFIRTMCLSWGLIGLQLTIVSTFRASGKMLVTMGIAIATQIIFQLPLAYVLSTQTDFGARGIWWSYPLANAAAAIISVVAFKQGSWKKSNLTAEKRQSSKIADAVISEDGIR